VNRHLQLAVVLLERSPDRIKAQLHTLVRETGHVKPGPSSLGDLTGHHSARPWELGPPTGGEAPASWRRQLAAEELASGARDRLEPSARSDSGQIRGGFSEQTHSRAGYFDVVGGCGDCCRDRPDDSDHGGHAIGPDYLDRQCVGTVDGAGRQNG
jgi:hypothetical protein